METAECEENMQTEYKWTDRKRTFLGLPWSFTVYELTEEKLLIRTGFLNKHEEEVRLYRIMDLAYEQSLGERIFGLGTIHCWAADKSTPEFKIVHIKNSRAIKDYILEQSEKQRMKRRTLNTQSINAGNIDEFGDE